MAESNLEELTVKELQAEAVKLGMPENDAKLFVTKAPLIATINTLRASGAIKKVESLNAPASPQEEKQVEQSHKTKLEHMRSVLASQPKVERFYPLEGKETKGIVDWVFNEKTRRNEQVHRSGAIQPVTLNGFQYLVPKGVRVMIPQQVAQTIDEKYQQTSEAGEELLIDRLDPETGKTVRDQL